MLYVMPFAGKFRIILAIYTLQPPALSTHILKQTTLTPTQIRPFNMSAIDIYPTSKIKARGDSHTSTSPSPHPKKSLLDLPAELWSTIGHLVIDDTPHISDAFSDIHLRETHGARIPLAARKIMNQPPITRTCSALRHELLAYYYKNKVQASMFMDDRLYLVFPAWLEAMGRETRRHIKSIELIFVDGGSVEKVRELVKEWDIQDEVEVTPFGDGHQFDVKFR